MQCKKMHVNAVKYCMQKCMQIQKFEIQYIVNAVVCPKKALICDQNTLKMYSNVGE